MEQGTMKKKKGSYGYIDSNKKKKLIISSCGLGAIVTAFVLGLIITKTRLNWFTFVSVLGALPVGNMIVNMIVAFPHKSISIDAYNKIKGKEDGITILYDLVITSYENIMQIDSVAVKGNTLCAYTSDYKLNEDITTKYIKKILVNNGCNTSIKIFKDIDSYVSRIDEIKNNLNSEEKSETAKERDKSKEDKVVQTLLEISI